MKEMSKPMEPKQRTPGIIARLMGLEGLPSPRHVHRQQKRSSDCCLQKNNSFAFKLNSQPVRGSSMDQHEFKDVYEDLEASHVINHECSSKSLASSFLTILQQKFLDVEKEKMDNTLEMLHSNKYTLPKLPKHLASMDAKHSNGLQDDSNGSYGSSIAVLAPSEKFENNSKSRRAERHTSRKPHSISREDGLLLELNDRHRASPSQSSPRFLLEEFNEENTLPTMIVVLKPNMGKIGTAGTSSPLASLKREYSDNRTGGKESWIRNNLPHNTSSRLLSRKAMERLNTMTMKEGQNETADSKSNAYGGYIGDESSYESNGSDSECSESELFKLPYRKSFIERDFYHYSSSFEGSTVNKEAKKRLSERWKRAHINQNLDMGSRGSTLAEMLDLSDKDPKINLGGEGNRFCGFSGDAKMDVPLGISSRDGWKGNMSLTLSGSRSLTKSSGIASHRKGTHQGFLSENTPILRSGAECCSRNKAKKGNADDRVDSLSKNSSSVGQKGCSRHYLSSDEAGSSTKTKFEIQLDLAAADMSERLTGSRISGEVVNCTSPAVDTLIFPKYGSMILSPKASDIPAKQSSECHNSSHSCDKTSILQDLREELFVLRPQPLHCSTADSESLESSKEADHSSPVSVLEVTCQEDTSSSESFERVSVELHELRKNLQLLKLESGTYSEASTLRLIDEEEEETNLSSPSFSEQDKSECWQTSYALDVLIGSGLEESVFSLCGSNWQYPDYVLDPKLLDNLEKKYNYGTTPTKSKRKLLFDRLNSAVLDIFQDRVDCFPWVMPKLRDSKWDSEEVIRDAIGRLMSQDFSDWEISERELDKEMHWPDAKGDIDLIGIDIEKMLIDEIVSEIILKLSSSSRCFL